MTTARDRLLRYAFMKLARELDSRFELLLKTGRIAKWYSAIGYEATTVPAGLALAPGDTLCTLHRDLGAILAVYLDPARALPGLGFGEADGRRPDPHELLRTLACQLLGKADGFSQGVERSFHYGYFDRGAGIHHLGMISHLGAMIPVAAGAALAHQLAGDGGVAINFIGDGGTSTGDFHEGLNMAAVWRLPLVLVIENNRYAFSTPASAQYAAAQLSDRGLGYGLPAVTVDGNDPDAMAAVLEEAVAHARDGGGPTLIEAMLGRIRGHSAADDSLKVVPADELEGYLVADPVPNYAESLVADGVLDERVRERLEAQISALVEQSIDAALEAPGPAPEVARRPALVAVPAFVEELPSGEPEETTYIDAIHHALRQEMERDPNLLLMGQDIGVFEGAFRVTRGLFERWPERVRDTPIAESGTLGIAIGAALGGYPSVVEMQFGDFVSCGFNQIVNVAAKLYYRWQVPCPIVVRLPSGGGVTAGPFHSQNPESWFAHVAGLKVVCPATARDAGALLKAAIRDPNPVIFCEHKYLYRRVKEQLPVELPPEDLGVARVLRAGADVSLIGYGAATWTCLEAAEELAREGTAAEVVDLRTLVPFDRQTVLDSVSRTGRAVIVHEAQQTAGFGAEVAAQIAEAAFAWLDAPPKRVAYPDRPVPYARVLEQELLPGVAAVVAAVRELAQY